MGADIIGWRRCALQEKLNLDGFLSKLKLRSYKTLLEQRVPEARRHSIQLSIQIQGRPPRDLSYHDICEELVRFEAETKECSTCPLSGGVEVGCYQYVHYPVDTTFEETLFAWFVRQVTLPESLCARLFREHIHQAPVEGTSWHDRRGAQCSHPLAEREEPLFYAWEEHGETFYLDSAMLCSSLFVTLRHPSRIQDYARFWQEYLQDLPRQEQEAAIRLSMVGVNLVDLLEEGEEDHPLQRALRLSADLAASESIYEIRELSTMLNALHSHADPRGWSLEVDA